MNAALPWPLTTQGLRRPCWAQVGCACGSSSPQLAFSLEAKGWAVQCQVTELQEKLLWMTRMDSSCCQSKWGASGKCCQPPEPRGWPGLPQPRAGAQGSRALEEVRALLPQQLPPALFHLSPTPWQLPEPPTRNCHSAPGQAGKKALRSSTAGSAPRKEGSIALRNKA